MPEDLLVVFEPIGLRAAVEPGVTILDAARAAGVEMVAVCGGIGICDSCRVRLQEGALGPLSPDEQDALEPEELAGGFRLACQAVIRGDARIWILPESLAAAQRLQLEGDVPQQEKSFEPGRRGYGMAVDIGSTKIAAYLIDFETGGRLGAAGVVNPQVAYGEDIVSRIAAANRSPDDRLRLTHGLRDSINLLAGRLCDESGVGRDQVSEIVVVGNTVMHHFFAGLPVQPLGEVPFALAVRESMHVPAPEVGLDLARDANVYMPPLIAGYVGADHVAMASAAGLWEEKRTVVAIDIGTNTEISVVKEGRVRSCSCASGPAFEGAHIRDGMRAAPGAIERAKWADGRFRWHTVEDAPPVGFCGSGILDIVAEMASADLLDTHGRLKAGPGVLRVDGTLCCEIVPAAATRHGRSLTVARADVHEIQLAKGAIRAGIDILLQESGIGACDVDLFLVAGAFGTYLDLGSALRIGMFPAVPRDRFRQMGNAAGAGAVQLLLSESRRRATEAAVRSVMHVDLTTHPRFHDCFIEALFL